MSAERVSVLIAGAGPCGLSLAIELGSRGISCLLIERNERVGYAPRAKTTHTRSREHLRRWGIADKLAQASPFGVDYPSNIVFVTRMAGHLIGRIENAFNCAPQRNPLYSEHAQWVPQYVLEEVMRKHVETLPSVELRFNTEYVTSTQTASGVRSTLKDLLTGKEILVDSDYLVGADGPRSIIRDLIGAKMEGTYGLSHNYNIIFRAPGLAEAHAHGPGIMYWHVNPEVPGVIGPMDTGDRWFFMLPKLPAGGELTDDLAIAMIKKATGIDLPYEILSRDEWTASQFIANTYRDGRIFLGGDACHLHPPLGGYGMNLGIADAVDLGWKLAAVLQGWGGDTLLDSYEQERRPIHRLIINEAVANHSTLAQHLVRPGLEADTPEGAAVRREIGEAIALSKRREFRTLGVVLGYCVAESPINAADDESPPPLSLDYHPSARPGCVAPHAWLADGRSLYDTFGPGFTLLVLGDVPASVIQQASRDAEALSIPLAISAVDHPDLARLYGARLALVRPDQHVAWRSDAWPGRDLLKLVTGRNAATDHATESPETNVRIA